MTSPLAIYLRNHEAAARASFDLFQRVARSQRSGPYGSTLAALRDDVGRDLTSLQGLMRDLGVAPDPLLGVGLRLGERLGRLKPNGGLVRRQPLTDLVEIEALADAVHAKLAGWRALAAAHVGDQQRVAEVVRRSEDRPYDSNSCTPRWRPRG